MLVIRFARIGKRNHAQYRIVLAEKSAPVKGKFVELLGSYDPHQKIVTLKKDRIKKRIEQGAQVSDSVWNLLIAEKVIAGEKRKIAIKQKEKEGEEKSEEKSEEQAKPEEKEEAKEAEKKEEKPAEEQKSEEKEEKKDEAEVEAEKKEEK